MDRVESVLQNLSEKHSKYKTTQVQKDLDLELDEGNLLAIDPNPLNLKALRSEKESYLLDLARDNTQLLINRIWELPVERVENVITAKLPDPKTILPREKPIPKEKAVTKWQEYAKLKGIQKRKKGRMVWDEEVKEYRPRWGYKRANDETKPWLIEVPDNADPYEDLYEKRIKAKKERIAKNELQRLRNIARTSMKGKVPGVGLVPTDNPDKDQLSRALTVAKKSTASVGKFTETLSKEKKHSKSLGKKRKFESNTNNMQQEKKRALDVLQKIQNKRPTLDVNKAVGQQLHHEEVQRSSNKPDSNRKKGKGKGREGGGKKRPGKGNKKPKNFGGKAGAKKAGSKGGKKSQRGKK